MEKKIFISACLIWLLWLPGHSQSAYDKKLHTLYSNTVPTIRPAELAGLLNGKEPLVLLDTRSPVEFQVSHLPGAQFLDYQTFRPSAVKNIDPKVRIVVYCAVGYRSERIGEKLLAMGFKNVTNLYGGIFEWVNKGHEVVNKAGVATDSVHTYNQDWSRWLSRGIKIYE
jgi:rhodanese-related sulfurtransferase